MGSDAAPIETPADDVDVASGRDLQRALQAARDAAERAARLTSAPPRQAHPAQSPQEDVASPRPRPDPEPESHKVAIPLVSAASAAPASDDVATPPDVDPAHDSAAPSSPVAHERPGPEPGARIESHVPAARSAPSTGRAHAVDLASLLREQVFAALVERGSVPAGVTPVVDTASSRRTPRPGTSGVRAEGVVRIDPAAVEAPSGDVHVHIARVSVTQAPPTPPPAPRVSRSETVRRSVDHQAYLARRRERG